MLPALPPPCPRSRSTCRCAAITSGWLLVKPRARIDARSACAWASAEGPPEAPTPGKVCGVPANWPFIAASALCACTSCESMLLISDRAASMRWPIDPAPGSMPA